jgi:hypothetical protein
MSPARESASRRDLAPSSAVPLAYFAGAHVGLAAALLVLVVRPDVPGGFFYHPRMVALVHLVTLGWLSGSILGAFYIVAPLALGLPMRAGRIDWIAAGAFFLGTSGMASHFWIGGYDGMAWAAVLVVLAIGWVAFRACRGFRRATAPWPVTLHVGLAFVNILAAAVLGIVLGLDRTRGFWAVSPLAATYAHLHLAAIGWAGLMVVGLAYRLIPMMLPAAMPTGRMLALSAVLIETGLAILVVALIQRPEWAVLGAGAIAAGLVSFVTQIRRALAHRLPRPPALPRRDWSTWQVHVALLWLLVAAVLGFAIAVGVPDAWGTPLRWMYGVTGLVGFLAQIVVGMQGRLVPLYAWYRAMAARQGTPPERGANELPSPAFARVLFFAWTAGVPGLAGGLAFESHATIAVSSALLLLAVGVGGAYVMYLMRRARTPRGADPT